MSFESFHEDMTEQIFAPFFSIHILFPLAYGRSPSKDDLRPLEKRAVATGIFHLNAALTPGKIPLYT